MPDLPVKLPARLRAGILRLTACGRCRRAAVLLPLILLSLVLPPGVRMRQAPEEMAPREPAFGEIHYVPGYFSQDTADNATDD